MKQKNSNFGDIITIASVTVLLIVILSLVVVAAGGYRYAADSQMRNDNTRAVLSYIINCVRDSDAENVRIEDRMGTECLVISSRGGFEQRFYESEGHLMEEYGEAGSSSGDALTIGNVSGLRLRIEDGMLSISTDIGSSCVNISRVR